MSSWLALIVKYYLLHSVAGIETRNRCRLGDIVVQVRINLSHTSYFNLDHSQVIELLPYLGANNLFEGVIVTY